MEEVRLESLTPCGWPSPVVTVGNFDGVHRGHRVLIARAVDTARARHGTAVTLTFDPHPARVLAPDRAPAALNTKAQKAELLSGLGVDRLAVLPFGAEMAALSPEEFVRRVLVGAVEARVVVVGASFRFGRARGGDVAALLWLGERLGFEVVALEPVEWGGLPVSSSRVRDALGRGDVSEAASLLGRPFFVDGRVVRGDGRGRRLGLPTANLQVENETLPLSGVYAGFSRVDEGRWVPMVINLGRRPTFGGGRPSVEAHLLGFSGDLYGQRLRLEFRERLREERRFESTEALVAQIGADIAHARALLAPGRTPTV